MAILTLLKTDEVAVLFVGEEFIKKYVLRTHDNILIRVIENLRNHKDVYFIDVQQVDQIIRIPFNNTVSPIDLYSF